MTVYYLKISEYWQKPATTNASYIIVEQCASIGVTVVVTALLQWGYCGRTVSL